jgi:hypothetical protein
MRLSYNSFEEVLYLSTPDAAPVEEQATMTFFMDETDRRELYHFTKEHTLLYTLT